MPSFISREIQLKISPEEAAAAFCDFGSDEQAVFFNKVADISSTWKGGFTMQMQYLTVEKSLNPRGRAVMKTIGAYAEPQP